MAAGEDQPQPVVFDALGVRRGGVIRDRFDVLGVILQRVESRAPADSVDRLEAPGRDEPRPRIGGRTLPWPVLERRAEGFMQRLFGEIEVTEQPDQGGENAPRLGAVDGVHRVPHLPVHVFVHAHQPKSQRIPCQNRYCAL